MDWMGELPSWMQSYPLSTIAIPGSHDSGTFSLDPNGPFAPDQPKTLATILATFPCIARPIVYRWSVTQSLHYDDQLASGIRYFDLRVSSGPEVNQYSVVHGLYGLEIMSCLQCIRDYSTKHPSEVFILDINHFYDMQVSDHNALIRMIVSELGDLLVPAQASLESITLAGLWQTKGRVICIYQNSIAHFFAKFVWCSAAITSPWPNVTDKGKLISYLDTRYEMGPPPPRILYATQGILTPSTGVIVRHPMSSLKTDMALGATDTVLKWITSKEEDNWYNIVLVDFVNYEKFAAQIIALNRTKRAPAIVSFPLLFGHLQLVPPSGLDEPSKPKSGSCKVPEEARNEDSS
ncbi:putative PI-PLC X domain-containing protein 3 [Hypsibius exemplaris]|uniref:PI-PLC X domain-containing protein 3 n=1 Tax=Hypsibius exemplaris TaxID=2072580 RepID=A0A1W0XAJ3_HYPEX|nr:putative PI-PLC X domain-containing protein 3 [Hypsibius exemplaris]